MKQYSIMVDESKKQNKEYISELELKTLKGLVHEFFSYLDYTEESDSGIVFHPVYVSSCRVASIQPLARLLEAMRKKAGVI